MNYVCARCAVEMEELSEIAMAYGDMELPAAEGLRCPECGIHFLLEAMVVDQISTAEQMLEGK